DADGAKAHLPVLLKAVMRYLAPKPGESYLDLTAGYGGHAGSIVSKTATPNKAVLVDRDQMAIKALASWGVAGARLIHSDFLAAAKNLANAKQQFDMILADLGV